MYFHKEELMKRLLPLTLLVLMAAPSWASIESLGSVGIEASDKTGCHLSDGEKPIGNTIGLMVDAYGNHPKLENETILKIINIAIEAGCNIDETNPLGLSPLNSAILLNHPILVKLLLEHGANPRLKIFSPKKVINGKNSFDLYKLLKAKKDMSAIGNILVGYQ